MGRKIQKAVDVTTMGRFSDWQGKKVSSKFEKAGIPKGTIIGPRERIVAEAHQMGIPKGTILGERELGQIRRRLIRRDLRNRPVKKI